MGRGCAVSPNRSFNPDTNLASISLTLLPNGKSVYLSPGLNVLLRPMPEETAP